jgi:predicted nucleic acid-binding protein
LTVACVFALWDTTLASRLHPQGEVLDYVIDQAAAGTPVSVAAPAVLEIAYGYQRKAFRDARFGELLAWFTRFLASDALSVVPLDGRAALIAGRVRAALPHPPPSKADRRSKTMRQASWRLDVEIAATAFAAGFDVATENRRDFEALAQTLATVFPEAPRLAVVDGPG